MSERFPRSVYSVGSEPDPRFSLANERTYLAWVRTSLAMFAAGVALEALEVPVAPGFRAASAGVFVLLGLSALVQAWRGWARTERALREDRRLPGPSTGVVLGSGAGIAMLLLVAGVFV
ncbi:YidH family protein [Isoptericola aurantiacus]|uniref:YidH family protein n=1 Tax=Isoptericola aurantiacus TaxID=3377839 RepID=UPI00383AC7D2